MSTIDWWDTEAQRHAGCYLAAHGRDIADRFPGRLPEAQRIVRRHANAWAKECREAQMLPTDGGKVLWQMRMRQAEAEISNTLPNIPAMPTEQIGLLEKGTEMNSHTPGGSRHAHDH